MWGIFSPFPSGGFLLKSHVLWIFINNNVLLCLGNDTHNHKIILYFVFIVLLLGLEFFNYSGYSRFNLTTCLVQWLSRLTAIQEVPGSIPGYTLVIFLEAQGLERGPPSLLRPIGQLLEMRSSEIRLRKLKLRLRDSALLTTRPPVLRSGSNRISRSRLFGAVAPRI